MMPIHEKFGVNARSAIDYIKLGENAGLVLGTIERAIKAGEPISQAKILELLDAHRVLKGALNFRVKYLQVYERILTDHGDAYDSDDDSMAGKTSTL